MKTKLLFFSLLLLAMGGSLFAQANLPIVSGVVIADVGQYQSFKVVIGATVTSVVLNSSTTRAPYGGQTISILFAENATGGFGVTFGGNINNPCTVTTTANAASLCQFQYDASANQWNGVSSSSGSGSISNLFAADTGSGANVYVTAPPVAATLTNLQQTYFTVAHANSGPSTINVSGTGVKNLTKLGTTALATGDLITGVTYYAIYDGTEWVVQNTSGGSGVTTVQYGANSALSGAIIETYGVGFASPSQSGQTVTNALNQASTSLIGVTTYAGAGGAIWIPCATKQKAETATADANVLTCAPAVAAGTYRISVVISVSAATSGIIGWTAAWTDSNGNAQTPVELELFQNATAAPALTFTTSAVSNYHGSALIDVNNAGTNIVIKWIGGGTTTAKMSAMVEQIQ